MPLSCLEAQLIVEYILDPDASIFATQKKFVW